MKGLTVKSYTDKIKKENSRSKILPKCIPAFFFQYCQQIDEIVEGGDYEEDFANQDDLVPALIAVEKADGLDTVPGSNTTAGELCRGRHHRE